MDCSAAIDRLNTYLDRELNQTEVAEVQEHLHACPECLTMFQFQVEVKRLVRVCLGCDTAPEALRTRVRIALRNT